MNIKLTKITPEWAARVLEHQNGHNRRLSKNRVAGMADDIRSGRWVVNGESIKFSQDGELLDGQHRLSAVVQANEAIESYIVTGVSADVMPTIDSGLARRARDVLEIAGEKWSTHLASLVKQVLFYGSGLMHTQKARNMANYMTNSEVAEGLAKYPWIRNGLRGLRNGAISLGVGGPVSLVAALLRDEWMPTFDTFLDQVADGAGLTQTDAVYHLRKVLINKKAGVGRGYEPAQKRHLVFKAWNSYAEGRSVRHLKYDIREALPEVAGARIKPGEWAN